MIDQAKRADTMKERSPLDVLVDMLADRVTQVIDEKRDTAKKYLSIDEAKAYTNLSGSTLRTRVREGVVRKVKHRGRVYFERDALDRMIAGEPQPETS